MAVESSSCDVAIVGAGPVGLLLAGELAARAIRVMVLERSDALSAVPKANGIVGHATVELAKRRILTGTGLRVVSPPRFPFGALELNLGFGPGNPLHIMPIPQRRLEELLQLRAARSGAELRRGREVVGFEQSGSGVTVETRGPEGTSRMRARYLVGCDGAHSMVRKHAGIGFPGFTSDQIALIARVTIPAARVVRKGDGLEISGVGRFAAMRPNQLPGGLFTIAPQDVLDPTAPGDQYLISTHEPRGESDPSDAVSVEELRESLLRVLGADLPFSEATAIRSIVGNSRQADAYRRGRVFLAGDAAYIFNAGGSALNVGLQDAFELARCLAAAVRDRAPEAAIAGYEAARRPAGERALQLTRAQAALSRDDANGRAVREVIGELVSSRSGARRLARLIEGA
jgi:2-polyprenyl-6-methoxyphenol hydroxylase-like FAD-dependent oxidoreductase